MNKKYIKKEMDFAGKKLVLETGELASRANVAVKVTYGDSVVLVTVVSSPTTEEIDYLPLMVQYEEKLYASGTIKNSRFLKRDGRATDDAVIVRRVIDHAIRPLFPKDFTHEVQVVATVLSLDMEADPKFLSMVGASAALQASEIPFHGPMVTVSVGCENDKFVLNPSLETAENSDLEMVVSFVGKDKRFLAVEAGANVLPEAKIIEAINFARDNSDPLLEFIESFVKEINPESKKVEYTPKTLNDTLVSEMAKVLEKEVSGLVSEGLEKLAKDEKFSIIKAKAVTQSGESYTLTDIEAVLADFEKKAIKKLVLEEGKRIDGRGMKDVRPITTKVGVLPRVHGSGLFTRGTTQALTVATLGSPGDELLIQDMYGERSKRFMHFYNFPPYSTGETGSFGGPKGREIGHGMIAEKALRPVIPSQKDFPYTIILVSEILSSNGSSSMASSCGSSLALMDAGVPIKAMVGGVAMGLMVEDDSFSKYQILTDLSGEEDGGGYLDFKMTGTREGVTAIQCDMKVKGMPMKVLEEVILQSREGRLFILDEMTKVISEPKTQLSKYAPKMLQTKIDPDKIGIVIGSGGKTIKEIQEQTGTELHIEEDGTVIISSDSKGDAQRALEIVEGLTKDVKPGEIYDGTIVDILDFGALVEILPSKVGLLHVSEITNSYVKNVRDWFKVGDKVQVKVLSVEREGKISLSHKALEK